MSSALLGAYAKDDFLKGKGPGLGVAMRTYKPIDELAFVRAWGRYNA